MRYNILLSASLFSCCISFAQKNNSPAFSISSDGNSGWMNINQVDLSSGVITRQIFEREKTGFVLLDAHTRKQIDKEAITRKVMVMHRNGLGSDLVLKRRSSPVLAEKTVLPNGDVVQYVAPPPPAPVVTGSPVTKAHAVASGVTVQKASSVYGKDHVMTLTAYEHPTATMVAAAAYDKRHHKLFFTPMRFAELRWVDLYDDKAALQVYCLTEKMLVEKNARTDANQVTRMVIAADGNGYALSNDAKTFVQFTTGKRPDIRQLGEVKNNTSKQGVSIHDRSMFGGDMIADAFGNLYLFTGSANVFRIDIKKREATHLGAITGLPKQFSTNGAAVDDEGKVIVSSANSREGFYKVDIESLRAEKLNDAQQRFASSDLASGNLLFENRARDLTSGTIANAPGVQGKIALFPNPVTQGQFRLTFANAEAGDYQVQLVDLSGQIVSQQRFIIGARNQVIPVKVERGLARGIYLVKVLNGSRKIVSTGNILVH